MTEDGRQEEGEETEMEREWEKGKGIQVIQKRIFRILA